MSDNQIIPVPENFDNTQFPEGLRVLAVDDDPICLRILEGLLLKCRYKVTATSDISEAYEMLKQNKNNFDIVITDLYKHDQTNFSLLKAISLEMDLPVVMISAQDDTSTVMKGIMHGVTSYLLKPVRVEELMNIWQHVVRKSLSNPNSSKSSTPEVVTAENPLVCPVKDSKEKEDANNSSGGDDDIGTSQKKPRIAWTHELHLKFLDAIEKLGGSNSLDAVPKKILSLMKEPGLGEENIASQLQLLSRENVASHLQKYRKMLKQGKTLRTSQESYSGADSNQMHSSLTFDNGRLPNIMSGLNGHNSSGCSIPKDVPCMLSHMGSNSNSSFQFQNQPNVMLQAYPQISQFQSRDHPPQISQIIDQNRPLRFGPRMPNNLMKASPSFQSYSANTEPYPSAPKLVYQPPPHQMLGGAPTTIIEIPDQKNLVMPIQSYKPGQSFFVPSQNMAIGQHEYDSSSFGAWGSTGNGQINSFQPFQDNIETESNLDEEFTSMIDQFKNNDPPQL